MKVFRDKRWLYLLVFGVLVIIETLNDGVGYVPVVGDIIESTSDLMLNASELVLAYYALFHGRGRR